MSERMQDVLARAQGVLRYEPIERRVRARLGTTTVVDSTRAVLVWEPRRVCPSYAVPAADIHAELTPTAPSDTEVPGVLHPRVPFAVHTTPGEPLSIAGRDGAGFRFADDALAGYVELDFEAFDALYEEDEQVFGHPRDPFHRVDVRLTSRPVRIETDGELVASTTRARLAYETGLPTRFYIPRADVRVALEPSSTRTYCPYKGEASYWSFSAGGRRYEDLGWSYEHPLADMAEIAGLIAFWDDRLDVDLDGERRTPPATAVSAALLDEFGA
jgi:uncharacterized protein (DUF427 family)